MRLQRVVLCKGRVSRCGYSLKPRIKSTLHSKPKTILFGFRRTLADQTEEYFTIAMAVVVTIRAVGSVAGL